MPADDAITSCGDEFRHVVMVQWKPEASEQQRAAAVSRLQQPMKRTSPWTAAPDSLFHGRPPVKQGATERKAGSLLTVLGI
jgi:hypothetical protein